MSSAVAGKRPNGWLFLGSYPQLRLYHHQNTATSAKMPRLTRLSELTRVR